MRRALFRLFLFSFLAWLAAACGPQQPPKPAPEAVRELPPAVPHIEDDGPLDLEHAQGIIGRIEAQWPMPEDHPLLTPKDIEDVRKILKLDQVRLFPKGVELARTIKGLEARALEAQIELAWGEAYMILMDVLLRVNQQFDIRAMVLGGRVSLLKKQEVELEWLQETVQDITRLVEAFQLLSIDHISKGSRLADEIIESHTDSYLGYRLAADYYRTVRDWKNFDAMVKKVEATNPDSNGLIFLRGAATFMRNGDAAAAESFHRKALANDPDFVRAQAHLTLIQTDIKKLHAELLALEAMNPDHQIVRWAGAAIRRAYRR